MNLAVHHRQFVIAKEPILVNQDWRSMILSNEFYLSHQADLPVRILERNARRLVMIGQAFAGEDGDGRDDLSHELSGRFTWIDWPYLYTDASALLPVYYTGHLDEPLITSSVALAAKLADAAVSRRSIRWGGLNWTPPPGSSVSNLGKLLRDQRLYIPSAAVEFVDRSIRPAASFDQAKQRLASDLTTISRSVGKRSGTLYLALTAGLDSRTLLSSLLAAGVKFECVTQKFQGVSRSDVEVAGQISRYLGVQHHVIGPNPRNEDSVRLWREHTLETHSDADDTHLIPQDSTGS